MTKPTPPDPQPGTITAAEPDTEPAHPLRADDVQPLIPKEIG